jgi:hypothetical protein
MDDGDMLISEAAQRLSLSGEYLRLLEWEDIGGR